MKITREDIVNAADLIALYPDTEDETGDFEIREAYSPSYGMTCPAVVLPGNEALQFIAALSVHLTENDRAGDALDLATSARTDSMGRGTVVYWPDVELAD